MVGVGVVPVCFGIRLGSCKSRKSLASRRPWAAIFFRCENRFQSQIARWNCHMLGSVLGRTDFFAAFYFSRRIFPRIFSPDLFSSSLWEKVPRKILQDNPRQNPPKIIQQKSPTHFCRGVGPTYGPRCTAIGWIFC